MRIIVDTNVLISGVFFGGAPRKVIEQVASGHVSASATPAIIEEYDRVVQEMIRRKQGKLRTDALAYLMSRIEVIEPRTVVEICRDPDDDKFIACAIDASALYIVSGDKDLLYLEAHQGIRIITAAEFCEQHL